MTGLFVNLNGDIISEKLCGLSIHNRAFKYGDSLFETIKIINGKAVFAEDHFSRLTKGMTEMRYEFPPFWELTYFKMEMNKVIQKNNIRKGGRLRFTVFRKGEGYYIPESNEVGYVVEAAGSAENGFSLNEKGIKIGLYSEIKILPNKFSAYKTNNCLLYTDAGMWARENDFEDVLLLNDKGNIVEAVSSNIFLLVDGFLYTPSIKEGPKAGIMRKKVIQLAKKTNLPVIETAVSTAVLNNAEEVFLTNAIKGVQWVSGFSKKRYFHKLSGKLVQMLNEVTS